MAGLPNVQIVLQNGNLGGIAAFAEGVAALIGTGAAVANKIQIGDPRMVTSLAGAEVIGITLEDNPDMYRHVKEFYEGAGLTSNAELYLMIVPNTMTQTQMWDLSNENGIVKLLEYAQGRIRLAASFFKPAGGYSPTLTHAIDEDSLTALQKAQATGEAYAANNVPIRCVIEGRAFNGTTANLTDLHTYSYNRAGILIAGSANDGSASVGALLGRYAKNPVQRKPSRIKDGAVPIVEAYIGSTKIDNFSGMDTVHDKGYMTLRIVNGKVGYYFNGGFSASSASDDYHLIERGRVIDKAHIIAYQTYLEELDDEVLIEADGTLSIGRVKTLEKKIEQVINEAMTAQSEVSSVTATINPAQNLLSNPTLSVALNIVPVGYQSAIKVYLGFTNPNNQ